LELLHLADIDVARLRLFERGDVRAVLRRGIREFNSIASPSDSGITSKSENPV